MGLQGPGATLGSRVRPSALWAKSVTWGTPWAVSSCFSAPYSFLLLCPSSGSFFSISFAGFSFSCFPVSLSLPSLHENCPPPTQVFFLFFHLPFLHPSLSFSVFLVSPFLLFSHSSSLPLISPVALSLLPPPSVSFILHFCIICPEQHARERVSVQRQDSPKFPPEPNPYSTSLFIPTLFFPSWGPGSALGRGAIEPPSCFPGLMEKSRWMLTGAMGGGGEDFE